MTGQLSNYRCKHGPASLASLRQIAGDVPRPHARACVSMACSRRKPSVRRSSVAQLNEAEGKQVLEETGVQGTGYSVSFLGPVSTSLPPTPSNEHLRQHGTGLCGQGRVSRGRKWPEIQMRPLFSGDEIMLLSSCVGPQSEDPVLRPAGPWRWREVGKLRQGRPARPQEGFVAARRRHRGTNCQRRPSDPDKFREPRINYSSNSK